MHMSHTSFLLLQLSNAVFLRTTIERAAKTMFMKNREPKDAAIFYIIAGRKNALTQLVRPLDLAGRKETNGNLR